jgi:hypothetical protein
MVTEVGQYHRRSKQNLATTPHYVHDLFMTAQPTPATSLGTQTHAETSSAAAAWAQDSQHYLKMLRELADSGMAMVRIVHQRVRQQTDEPPINPVTASRRPALSFDRLPVYDAKSECVREACDAFDILSRAIRRTILLAEKLATAPTIPPSLTHASLTHPSTHPNAAHPRIIRDAAKGDPANGEHERQDTHAAEAEHLSPERLDRLERPGREDDLAPVPIAKFVDDVRREYASVELNFLQPGPPQDTESPASALSAPTIARVPPPEAPASPSAHQPAPAIPPPPFPRL